MTPPRPSLPPDAPPGDDELHAWADGRLSADAAARLEQRVAADPAARARAEAWRQQRDELRQWARGLADGMAPPNDSLQAAAHAVDATRARALRRRGHLALAAGVLMAFAAGWLGHGAWRAHGSAAGGAVLARQFANDAALAHVVYVPEVRHPVEVGAAQQDHLVQWLSKRLGRPLKVPQLQAQGFELVGGRLLPGEGGARAQFMFQNPAGARLTLYVGVLDGTGSAPPETAFRFSNDEGVPRFYWVDQGMGYALSGALTREQLMALSEAVYQQLTPGGGRPG